MLISKYFKCDWSLTEYLEQHVGSRLQNFGLINLLTYACYLSSRSMGHSPTFTILLMSAYNSRHSVFFSPPLFPLPEIMNRSMLHHQWKPKSTGRPFHSRMGSLNNAHARAHTRDSNLGSNGLVRESTTLRPLSRHSTKLMLTSINPRYYATILHCNCLTPDTDWLRLSCLLPRTPRITPQS